MRSLAALGAVVGCVIGLAGGYVAASPIVALYGDRIPKDIASIHWIKPLDTILLNGVIDRIDFEQRIFTMRAKLPGSINDTLLVRFSFDSVEDVSFLDDAGSPQRILSAEGAHLPGEQKDFALIRRGDITTARLQRVTGSFRANSITIRAPASGYENEY